MKYSQASIGRVFVLGLEDGDLLPSVIEEFAREQGLTRGLVTMLGALQKGRLVAGPEDPEAKPVSILTSEVEQPHETLVLGTIFPDEQGRPVAHLHGALARGERVSMGCLRLGVQVWQVAEVVLLELTGSGALRRFNPELGFSLLEP